MFLKKKCERLSPEKFQKFIKHRLIQIYVATLIQI